MYPFSKQRDRTTSFSNSLNHPLFQILNYTTRYRGIHRGIIYLIELYFNTTNLSTTI